LCEVDLPEGGKSGQQVIVPRKGVLELQRILGNEEQTLEVAIGSNHVRVQIGDIRFTSKLIDGRFQSTDASFPTIRRCSSRRFVTICARRCSARDPVQREISWHPFCGEAERA